MEFWYGIFSIDSSKSTIREFRKAINCSQYEKIKNGSLVLDNYLARPFEEYYCPPPDFKWDLEGTYGSKKYLSWDIHIRKCVNTTENGNKCYSDQRINEVYELFWVHILQSNNVIDPSNLLLTKDSCLSQRRQ